MTKSFPRRPEPSKRAPAFIAVRLRAALLRRRPSALSGVGMAGMRRADGLEFAELRGYCEGDDPRRIDWAASARAGALQSRVFLEEAPLVFAALVDATDSMRVGHAESQQDAGERAAALWYSAARGDDRSVRVWSTRLIRVGSGAGRASAAVCERAREPAAVSLAAGLRIAVATLPRGTKLLVVTDGFEIDEELIARAARRFDLTVLVPNDPLSGEIALRGFVKVRDAETERVRTVYFGREGRRRVASAFARHQYETIARFREVGARAGVLDSADVGASLLSAVIGA